MLKNLRLWCACAAASVALVSTALAGKEEVQKYLDLAKEQVLSQSWDDAGLNIELAETEVAGLADAEKKECESAIASMKASLLEAKGKAMKPALIRKIDRALDDAKAQIGGAMFDGMIAPAEEILANKDNLAILGDEGVKYVKQVGTFRSLHRKKFAELVVSQGQEEMAAFTNEMKEKLAEIQNPETSPNSKESAIESLERRFDRWDKWFASAPADDARVKEMKKLVDAERDKFTTLALADRVKEVREELQRAWELYKDEWDGHETETAVDWETYRSRVGNATIDNFGTPKSRALVERYESFVANRAEDERYQSVKGSAELVAYMDAVAKTEAAARARLLAAVKKVVDGAEADTITEATKDNFERLEDSLRVLLVNSSGAQDGQVAAQRARIVKKLQAFTDATEGAAKAREAWYDAMTVSAVKNWAELPKSLSPESGFDPANPGAFEGKLIRIETDNLMGWRYKPGTFPFATTLNGYSIAGTYSDDVKKAIDAVQEKLGRDLGDDDRDGKWVVIARVTGKTGRMMQKKQAEGDIVEKGTGDVVGKYTLDYSEPVDAPIVQIIAVKVGPLAVTQDVGMAKEDGSVGSP
jgi:hypothetical protein